MNFGGQVKESGQSMVNMQGNTSSANKNKTNVTKGDKILYIWYIRNFKMIRKITHSDWLRQEIVKKRWQE
jgi:phosphoribosylaminoimidazole carboxylase (NCAIR synthetase)